MFSKTFNYLKYYLRKYGLTPITPNTLNNNM